MRRKTGIILILIANIIMLVHLVMPHHNHNLSEIKCRIVCHIENSTNKVCPHNDTQQINGNSSDTAHHTLDFEDCLLENIHIRYDEHNQISENDIADISPLTLLQNEILITSEPMEEINKKVLKPYLLTKYNTNYVRTIGLRAPPCC